MFHLDRKLGSLTLTDSRTGVLGHKSALLFSLMALLGRLVGVISAEGVERVRDFVRRLPEAFMPPEARGSMALAPIVIRSERSRLTERARRELLRQRTPGRHA